MAVITIGQFGGLMPSVQARNLPDTSAQTAHNLDLRYGDFRPLPGPGASVTTVAAATKSLFRTPSGVWLSSTNDVNYVNGQVNDAESERVYLTGRSAYPEAWESGAYRQLGVPKPTVAPTVSLVETGEFTDEELDDAREEIQATIVAAADDALTETVVGNAIPAGGPVDLSGADPLYQYVELHIRADGTVGSKNFTDSSRLHRAITANTAVIASGSGLTGGNQVARFSGGKGLTFAKIEADRAEDWQLDLFFKNTVEADEVHVGSHDMRVTYVRLHDTADGDDYDLAGNADRDTRDTSVIVSTGPGGAGVPNTDETQKLTLVNRGGTDLRLFLRGIAVGSAEARGIDLSAVGWVGDGDGFFGDIEEVRFTKGIQRDEAELTTATLVPFPSASGAQGFWLMHGATTPMPTTDELQAVYCVPVVQSNGEYIAINPDQNYLLGPAFNGQKITYLGEEYWALPMFYRANGYSVDRSGFIADLLAIENPATPPDPLFTNAQATSIANEVLDPFDTSKDPAKEYVRQINLQQQAVINAIASGTAQTSGTTVSAVASLEAAAQNATSYFANLYAKVAASARDIFNELVEPILPEAVTRTLDTRAYVYTYVTDWGEESAPSPASDLLELDQNDSVNVTVSAPPSGRHIVGWRLYRSSTTNVGAAYQLVADKVVGNAVLDGVDFDYFDIDTLTYSDAKLQEELQEVLATLTWAEPPANLIGLVGLPNGIMAGFFGKTLCFSEPFAPYAWPIEYQLTLEHNIVGLGVFGQTLVVLTEGNPYYASGADSASMSLQKLESTQSCVAKRTIASMEGGVVYASPDGLCLASPNGVELLTTGAFERQDWKELVPEERFGGFHEGIYYLFRALPTVAIGTATLAGAADVSAEGAGAPPVTAAGTLAGSSELAAVSPVAAFPGFVALSSTGVLGDGQHVMRSDDGTTWEIENSITTYDGPYRDVVYSPSLNRVCAVALGNDLHMSTPGLSAQVITSDNYGVTWTKRIAADTTNYWSCVEWASGLNKFVALSPGINSGTDGGGTTTRIMTSPDGITWTGRTAPALAQWRDLAWADEIDLLVAVASDGSGNRVMFSSDAVSWEMWPASDNASAWQAITWSPEVSRFCAVASSGTNRVMTSNDGFTWGSRTPPITASWTDVCWCGGSLQIYVAVSAEGDVMTSPDGINWDLRTAATANVWSAIAFDGTTITVVAQSGTGNRVMTSTDGITWTSRTSAADKGWVAVCWAGS